MTIEQINACKKLGMTEGEIAEMAKADKAIDKGEKLFELPPELEKGAKKARQAGNCKGYTKKPDTAKREILQAIDDALCCLVDDVKVENPEGELTLYYNDVKYRVKLTKARK